MYRVPGASTDNREEPLHRELIEALCHGDPESADQAMRKHIRYGLENIVRAIRLDSGSASIQRLK